MNFQRLLFLAGLSFAFLGLLQYFIFPDLTQFKLLGWDNHLNRLTSTLLDPGFTGIILILTLFLSSKIKLTKNSKIFTIFILFLSILLTYSRATYLALISGLTVLFVAKNKKFALTLMIIVFLSLILLLPQKSGAGTNLFRTFSINQRLVSWSKGLQIARNKPLTGIGFNLLNDPSLGHSSSGIQNSYLFVLSTSGLIGLILFIYLIYNFFKLSTASNIFLASLTSITVHAFFTNTWFYPWVLIWTWTLLGGLQTKGTRSK